MKRLAFDIETAADESKIEDLPHPEVAIGNLKDPVKIDEKIQRAKTEQRANMALDPHFSRVVAIGAKINYDDPRWFEREAVFMPVAEADSSEAAMLASFWQMVGDSNAEQICTFNGAGFDVPYLMRRSLLLGIRPVQLPIDRYHIGPTDRHFDVCATLHRWEVGNGYSSNPLNYSRNQHFYAGKLLNRVPPHAEVKKGEIGQLIAAGQTQIVRDIVAWDAETTLLLAEKVAGFYA